MSAPVPIVILGLLLLAALFGGGFFLLGPLILGLPILVLLSVPPLYFGWDALTKERRRMRIKKFRDSAAARKQTFQADDRDTLAG